MSSEADGDPSWWSSTGQLDGLVDKGLLWNVIAMSFQEHQKPNKATLQMCLLSLLVGSREDRISLAPRSGNL